MIYRLGFLVIGLFWVTMNVLLWRAEFGVGRRGGSPVPVEVVVRRILTAPDDSSLEIQRNGARIGYCHWVAGAAEELTMETAPEMEGLPEGMVQKPTAYGVHLEGGILTGEGATRIRFELELELTAERDWREMRLRLGTRPSVWELKASAVTQEVEVRWGLEGGGMSMRRFTLEELRDPRRLVEEVGGPIVAALLPRLGLEPDGPGLSMGLEWEARSDWLRIGATRVQGYRLTARLLDRHEVVVVVSRVGEIMRVELPDGIALVNEVLVNF